MLSTWLKERILVVAAAGSVFDQNPITDGLSSYLALRSAYYLHYTSSRKYKKIQNKSGHEWLSYLKTFDDKY